MQDQRTRTTNKNSRSPEEEKVKCISFLIFIYCCVKIIESATPSILSILGGCLINVLLTVAGTITGGCLAWYNGIGSLQSETMGTAALGASAGLLVGYFTGTLFCSCCYGGCKGNSDPRQQEELSETSPLTLEQVLSHP